jgi:hypothetical protein
LDDIHPGIVKVIAAASSSTEPSKRTKEASDKEAIEAVLADEGQTADAIVQAAGLPVGTVRVRLETMFKEGRVDRSGNAEKNDPRLWSKIVPHKLHSYGAERNPAGVTWTSEL